MSIQEINRKHIIYGLIVMVILTFMPGCSSIEPKKCNDNTYTMAELMPVNSVYSIGILDAEWFGR